jgi:UDP-N-acetylglucosamine--N-acetylmuramyl-(pentapeptide) pyrophosphoryl-undecaprenol N-acetylglucosamine transferase
MKILIAGGGTGGHLFPALAVAEVFRERDPASQVLFVGSRRGLESSVLGREGYELKTIEAAGFKGKRLVGKLVSLLALPQSLAQSFRLLRSFRPDLVLGFGGYASGPVVLTAWAAGYRTAIHEQNAFPGLSNRLLGRFADRVFLSFEGSARHFPRAKTFVTGNPVRKRIWRENTAAVVRTEGRRLDSARKFTLFIFGGSQGAHRLNQAMGESLPHLGDLAGQIRIIHQTGDRDYEEVRRIYERKGLDARVYRFIQDMDRAYGEADLVLCRAGATTLFELMAMGKPAILVPYPYAANDHQTLNARTMADSGAALMLADADLNGLTLSRTLRQLSEDRERLAKLGERAAALAKPHAADRIADLCYALVRDE